MITVKHCETRDIMGFFHGTIEQLVDFATIHSIFVCLKIGYPNHWMVDTSWLVVLTILKNMKVNGKDYPIYYGK